MKSIGGYFELELRKGKPYHVDAFQLNTGRNALELILRVRNYTKVYIPYYTCEVLLEPFKKMNVEFQFYSIDENLEPIFDTKIIKEDEGFLYTNYFGLKDRFINSFVKSCRNLIVDNAQSFFSKPQLDVPTFYSCRKFFGVPDGAYLYTNKILDKSFPQDSSLERFEHLLGRIELGAEMMYSKFKENDDDLCGQPIKVMSRLTQSLLESINYKRIAKIRQQNFEFLHNILKKDNLIKFDYSQDAVPMVYPFLINKGAKLKQELILNKIFVPTYWPNVFEWAKREQFDYFLAENIVSIPVDQRYNYEDLDSILSIIKKFSDED